MRSGNAISAIFRVAAVLVAGTVVVGRPLFSGRTVGFWSNGIEGLLAISGLALALAAWALDDRERRRLPWASILIAALALWAFAAVSWAGYARGALYGAWLVAEYAAAFATLALALRTRSDGRLVAKAVVATAVVAG
ncbi:MAG: hypothetical protein ACYSU0_11710, partial [Planctomycetota bacterium]